ncbi:hypothetical protein MMC25_003081 [Agyrium rufum]|nr:hypothetical protein [Agyrium rufum]
MQAIQVTEYVSGPADLRISNLPIPEQSSRQYLIEIHAAATNFFDLLQIRGKYQNQPPFPWISGVEFAGVVLAVPPSQEAAKFAVGDRVFGGTQGAYATHICAEESQLHPVPNGWSFLDAAGLYVTAPTSFAGLVTRANVKASDYVLVHAAAGGVGLAAVQIAKAFGAIVIATAGSPRKLEVAKAFGADHAIDYRVSGWENEVKKLTPKGKGVDIVYDPVGMVEKSLKCTAWNGRIIVVGFAAGQIEKVAMNRVLLKNVSLVGLHWGAYAKEERSVVPQVWDGLYDLIEKKAFRGFSFQDKEYIGLKKLPEALLDLGGRHTWGKVVVKLQRQSDSKI